MTQIVDLRPNFGDDFARIFLERERMKIAQEAQKFREQQTKYENEQKEQDKEKQQSLMEGQTSGILQGLLNTPEGQNLLAQAAQPYADAFNTFFGGNNTPAQLGLNPQSIAGGLRTSPEPYAAAGYVSALQGAEKQQYTRGVEEKRFDWDVEKFNKTFGLDERRLSHTQFMDGARLDLEEARLNMERDNFDQTSTFQALAIIQNMQDRATEAFRAELAYRISPQGLNEDGPTAYQRASVNNFARLTPPNAQEMAAQASTAVDALGRGVPISMIGTIALADGSDPLRQLANLGLDERVVAAIGRGLDQGVGGYEMFREVHGAIAERRGRLTKDEEKNIESQYGMDADDYYANQLHQFTTWFAENYSDESPGRLITIYRNSLIDPDERVFDPDEKFELGGKDSMAKFLWSALTVWDAKSSKEEKTKASNALREAGLDTIADQESIPGVDEGGEGDAQTMRDFASFLWEASTVWSAKSGQSIGQVGTEGAGRPAPTGPGVAPGARPGLAPGTDPSQLQTSVFGNPGGSQAPGVTPPGRSILEMFGGGGTRSDSFSVPSDPSIDRPRNIRGDAAEVPGWLPPEQAQAYQDTAQMLRDAGVDEKTVQLLLELNFPPPSLSSGRSAGRPYSDLF